MPGAGPDEREDASDIALHPERLNQDRSVRQQVEQRMVESGVPGAIAAVDWLSSLANETREGICRGAPRRSGGGARVSGYLKRGRGTKVAFVKRPQASQLCPERPRQLRGRLPQHLGEPLPGRDSVRNRKQRVGWPRTPNPRRRQRLGGHQDAIVPGDVALRVPQPAVYPDV
jgi:hypothetical protein